MNVTALLAHPDDELMCAGTLARFAAEGHGVHLIVCHVDNVRAPELAESADALGVGLTAEPWPDDYFGFDRNSVREVERLVGDTDVLISHRIADHNTSHVPLAQIARTLTRHNRISLWELDEPIPGGIQTDGRANNLLVDTTFRQPEKLRAIDAYQSQLAKYGKGWKVAQMHRDLLHGWQLHETDDQRATAEAFRIVKAVWP